MPELRDLFDAPFVEGGRDPETGLDCWGLSREVMRRYGHDVPDFAQAIYDALEINGHYKNALRNPQWLSIPEAEPGCIVAMACDPELPGIIQHVGVYIGDFRVIHTLGKLNVSTFRLDDRFWGKKIKGFYRWVR